MPSAPEGDIIKHINGVVFYLETAPRGEIYTCRRDHIERTEPKLQGQILPQPEG